MPETRVNLYETRVRSHQTDVNGVMYHGAFLDVFDDARIETFRRLGYTYRDVVEEGWFLVIRRIECEYLAPARMDELLSIAFRVVKFTPATMTARYECRRDDELVARGTWVYAFVDANNRPLRVPERVRRVVAETPELRLSAP